MVKTTQNRSHYKRNKTETKNKTHKTSTSNTKNNSLKKEKNITRNKSYDNKKPNLLLYISLAIIIILSIVILAAIRINALDLLNDNNSNKSISQTDKPIIIKNFEERQNIIEREYIKLYAKESGRNALSLLEASVSIDYDLYDFGVFIKEVNGVAGNSKYYWALYYNGNYAEKGVDMIILDTNDYVELRYEKIEEFKL